MKRICSRCGKMFDTENCERYSNIRWNKYFVKQNGGVFGDFVLCGDCTNDFDDFGAPKDDWLLRVIGECFKECANGQTR